MNWWHTRARPDLQGYASSEADATVTQSHVGLIPVFLNLNTIRLLQLRYLVNHVGHSEEA